MRTFSNTAAAYDACQCDESIRNGDLLVITSEGVIGLAWTWPLAVTVAHGELHYAKEGVARIDRLLKDSGITVGQVRVAIEHADAHGFPVQDVWRAAVQPPDGRPLELLHNERKRLPQQVSIDQLPEHQQDAAMHETEVASRDHPSVLLDGGAARVHVFQMSGEWQVWINTSDADFTGLCLAAAATRDEAVAAAVATLEEAHDFLQGPPADFATGVRMDDAKSGPTLSMQLPEGILVGDGPFDPERVLGRGGDPARCTTDGHADNGFGKCLRCGADLKGGTR